MLSVEQQCQVETRQPVLVLREVLAMTGASFTRARASCVPRSGTVLVPFINIHAKLTIAANFEKL